MLRPTYFLFKTQVAPAFAPFLFLQHLGSSYFPLWQPLKSDHVVDKEMMMDMWIITDQMKNQNIQFLLQKKDGEANEP